MIIDWLAREGWIIVSWWLYVTLAGIAVMPLIMRLLHGLPDKGYTLARAIGLLIVGFVFWILGVFGFLQNNPGSMVFAWLIVLIIAWIGYFNLPGERPAWQTWWHENRSVIVIGELLFIVLLIGWALFRAHHPNLTGTEKPMELAFMSAVQRSESFPPNDPWMSGYAISYYHFGYILSASLATLSGISTSVGFNMTIALLFALTGLTAYGVGYNLVRSKHQMQGNAPSASRFGAISSGLLTMVFVIFMGNFQLPLIELPYQSGMGSPAYFEFWDAQDRTTPNPQSFSPDQTLNVAGLQILDPAYWNFWWWFRASRVINDRHLPTLDASGELSARAVGANVIDEFPQFSFLLADVHPHVLALPFAVMTIGLALNLLLVGTPPTLPQTIFYGITVGGLMFLNMWDGPIYLVVLVGADGLRRLINNQGYNLKINDWTGLGLFFAAIIGVVVIAYFMFFISFRSQASGLIPNVEFPTLFRQYFIMFGPFVLLLAPYLGYEIWRGRHQMNWKLGIRVILALLLGLISFLVVLFIAGAILSTVRQSVLGYIDAGGGFGVVLSLALIKRLTHGLTTVILSAVLVIVVARLFVRQDTTSTVPYSLGTAFALFIIACGAGLTLVPEFVYLRDNFGVRINTIFKFYYQAWVMFAIGSAYAVHTILANTSKGLTPLRLAYSVLLMATVFAGSLYPIFGIQNRALYESGRGTTINASPLTLDGGATLATESDYQAIQCLGDIVGDDDTVVVEAVGPAYRHQYGRVGVLTGIPIVLGWEGHQRQWRGNTYNAIAGGRRADIETLYNDLRWDVAASIIMKYDIDYIFYGSTERYGTGEQEPFNAAGEDKFRENLETVCEFGDSLFYQVTPRALQLAGVNP